jgi:hypothetical protein
VLNQLEQILDQGYAHTTRILTVEQHRVSAIPQRSYVLDLGCLRANR